MPRARCAAVRCTPGNAVKVRNVHSTPRIGAVRTISQCFVRSGERLLGEPRYVGDRSIDRGMRRSVRHRFARGAASAAILLLLNHAVSAQTAPSPDPPAQDPGIGAPTSPLAIHIGDADVLFGGFIDAIAIRRDANTGSGLGTSFGTIPFDNTVQGRMSDTQFSSQNSRLTLEATGKRGTADLKAALEVDFLGNAPNGLNVTTNSNTLRMRVFWGRYRHGGFEFLAGQAWSLMTPNRN